MQEPNRKRGCPVPVHITLYGPAALTKTNRANKNVKYNIRKYDSVNISQNFSPVNENVISSNYNYRVKTNVIDYSVITCNGKSG
jgi:hypothetical protein